MSTARDPIPRSTMTAAQQRRIGALQAAKAVLYGTNGGYGHGPARTCSVEGCDRAASTRGWCLAHYTRVLRTGSPGSAEVWDRKRRTCQVDGCEEPRKARGYCLNHKRHVEKGGHPDYVAPLRYGPDNQAWKGDEAGYNAAHDRVRRARGSARDHSCIDCGEPARHWSYNHRDPNELARPDGIPYSTDPGSYDPRCVRCHKRFDLAHLRAVAS